MAMYAIRDQIDSMARMGQSHLKGVDYLFLLAPWLVYWNTEFWDRIVEFDVFIFIMEFHRIVQKYFNFTVKIVISR